MMLRSLPGVGEGYMTGWDAYIDGDNTTVCWEKKDWRICTQIIV